MYHVFEAMHTALSTMGDTDLQDLSRRLLRFKCSGVLTNRQTGMVTMCQIPYLVFVQASFNTEATVTRPLTISKHSSIYFTLCDTFNPTERKTSSLQYCIGGYLCIAVLQ